MSDTDNESDSEDWHVCGFAYEGAVNAFSEMVATVSTVRLGRVLGRPGYWCFEPLPENAFVVLRRTSGKRQGPLQAAVVGEGGRLYELDPKVNASRTSAVTMYLHAPERYQVWWTLDAMPIS